MNDSLVFSVLLNVLKMCVDLLPAELKQVKVKSN